MSFIKAIDKERVIKGGLLLLAIGLIGYLVFNIHDLKEVNLAVRSITKISFLESKWAYFYLHLITLIPVLALSFDQKVAYYKSWRFLWLPIIIVGSGFIIWDVFFTLHGIWGFNTQYLSGFDFAYLPIEEWLFFVSVPFACVFIYECLNAYFPKDSLDVAETWITFGLIVVFGTISILYYTRPYTFLTFGLTSIFLILHKRYGTKSVRKRFYISYIVILLPFLIINGVLTGAFTEEPIVAYSEQAFMGKRIATIPVEDSVYGFLLLMSVVTGFEVLRTKRKGINK